MVSRELFRENGNTKKRTTVKSDKAQPFSSIKVLSELGTLLLVEMCRVTLHGQKVRRQKRNCGVINTLVFWEIGVEKSVIVLYERVTQVKSISVFLIKYYICMLREKSRWCRRKG